MVIELLHGNAPHPLHTDLAHWHLAASRLALPSIALGIAAGVAIVGIILTWRVPKPRWIFVLALAAVLGALRFDPAQPDLDQTSLATYNDQQIFFFPRSPRKLIRAPKALILLPSAALGLKLLHLAQQTIDPRPGRAFA